MARAASTAARPARLPGQERREHFLEVAAKLITDRGVDAVTMESVAAAAGVSKGLGYAYFSNRNELLLAVLEQELGDFERKILSAIADASTFENKVRGAVTAWFDAVIERGGLLGTLLTASQIQGPLQGRRAVVYRQLEEFYGEMASAEFGIRPDKATAAAAILLAGFGGMVERWLMAGDRRELLEETFVQLTLGGLRALAD